MSARGSATCRRGLPLRLQSGLVSADLSLAFEQRPRLSLRLAGEVGVADLKLADAESRDLLQVGSVKLRIEELRPLERIARLARIDIEAPHVLGVRNAAGKVNLLLAAAPPSGGALPVARVPLPTTAASAASAAGSARGTAATAASGTARAAPAAGGKASLAALSIRAGQLDWRDATTSPEAALAVQDFSFDAQAIAWPLEAPVVFKGEGVVGAAGDRGKLAFSGQGNAAGATLKIGLDDVPLAVARPYLRSLLRPPLAGALSTDLTLDWKPGGGVPQLRVDARRIAVAGLLLGDPKTPELAAEQIEMFDAHVDTVARSAAIAKLALQAPRLRLARDADGRWNAASWQGETAPGSTAAIASAPPSGVAPIAPASAPASTASPWRVTLGSLAVDKGRASFTDRSLAVPVAFDLLELSLQAERWAFDSAAAMPFQVRTRVAVPAGPSGRAVGAGVVGSIDARGELRGCVAGVPQGAKATLVLKDLPLHLLDPYLDALVQLDIQKAQTSFRGRVAWERSSAGNSLALRGDASIDDFRAASPVGGRAGPRRGGLAMVREPGSGPPLLNWKSLSLRGIDVALAPGARPRVTIAETALSDFFARIVLDEQGRLNLQEVARHGDAAAAPGASAASASAPAVPATTAASAVVVATPATPGLAPIVTMGPIAVVNGRVAFNDRFVKPNYSANLSELTGRLGAFSSEASASGPPQLADLELRGRAEGTASLEIAGKVNPLARPVALDIKAKVRELELPPLSPYAIKYAGYGIERGKLSVDLAYLVQPDGQLRASNRIVLHQLVFGEKVEGAGASLPVKLAAALLADRDGVIDIDLPVSGSINDPQFSIFGLVMKAIGNLIVKALTAPFSLLASSGGGSSETSAIEFAPGTATLTPQARESLDKIARALIEKPTLTLTISGESRLESEREAWKRERLQQTVRSEKRRQAIAGGASAGAEVTVDAVEYPALLKEVYKRADIVKPKNAVGLARDLAPAEMEALLLASIVVADDAMQQLAVRRAVVARDYLATRELPSSRLFLGAPKVVAGDDAAGWTPRVDLKLTLG